MFNIFGYLTSGNDASAMVFIHTFQSECLHVRHHFLTTRNAQWQSYKHHISKHTGKLTGVLVGLCLWASRKGTAGKQGAPGHWVADRLPVGSRGAGSLIFQQGEEHIVVLITWSCNTYTYTHKYWSVISFWSLCTVSLIMLRSLFLCKWHKWENVSCMFKFGLSEPDYGSPALSSLSCYFTHTFLTQL